MTELNPFQVMMCAIKGAEVSEDDVKKVSPFLMCKWLSGNPNTIQAANFFNTHPNVPIETIFKSVQRSFKGRIRFIQYPKNTNQKASKDVEYLSEYYNIRQELAYDYLKYISDEQLNHIREVMKNKYR
jgi:hypothetical protein